MAVGVASNTLRSNFTTSPCDWGSNHGGTVGALSKLLKTRAIPLIAKRVLIAEHWGIKWLSKPKR